MWEEFFKKAKEETLSEDSRHMIRARILEHIRNYPVREGVVGRFNNQRSVFGIKTKIRFAHMSLFAAIAIMALVGGGTSFAAEGALPGDALYPIKVNVNEQVQGWFAVGTLAKAELEAKFASRRLEEAEVLAATGRLRAEERSKIEDNFGKHADKTGRLVAELRNKNDFESAADVSSDLEATLKAHGKILAKLNIANGIAERAALAASDAYDERIETERAVVNGSSSALRVAAESQAKVAAKAVLRAKSFFDKNRETMNASATATFDSGLSVAGDKITEGNTKLTAGAYADAFMLFHDAKRIAREAQLLLQAHNEFKIGTRTREEVKTGPAAASPSRSEKSREPKEQEKRFESSSEAKLDASMNAKSEAESGGSVDARTQGGLMITSESDAGERDEDEDSAVIKSDGSIEVNFRL